jgi:hypothetical protein
MKTKVKAQELSISSKVYRYETGDESVEEISISLIENSRYEIIIRLETGINLKVEHEDTCKIYYGNSRYSSNVGYFFNYEDAREFALSTTQERINFYSEVYDKLHATLNQAEDEL